MFSQRRCWRCQVLRNVTPCRLDVSKDRSALASMATQSLATSEHKTTPHTLSPRSAVFGTFRNSDAAVVLVRPNSDTVCLFPSDSNLSKHRGHYKDHRIRTTAIPTLQPAETSEIHTHQKATPLTELQISRYLIICPRMKGNGQVR